MTPNKKDYIICASPRTGSSLLCEGLRRTQKCGNPKEYISPKHSEKLYRRGEFSIDPRSDFPGYLEEVRRERRKANGVFGIKIMWQQLKHFPESLGMRYRGANHRYLGRVLRESFGPTHFLWSRREDKLKQAISFFRAKQSGIFSAHQIDSDEARPEEVLKFDFKEIRKNKERLEEEERCWEKFFKVNKIRPLIVTYEDFVSDYAGTIKAALAHLDLSEEECEIASPKKNKRLADGLNQEWYRLYREQETRGGVPD